MWRLRSQAHLSFARTKLSMLQYRHILRTHIYALIGDKGRIALWTPSIATPTPEADDSASGSDSNDDDSQQAEKSIKTPRTSFGTRLPSNISVMRKGELAISGDSDPWKRCSWGPHPSQVILASRKSLDLIDFRVCMDRPCVDNQDLKKGHTQSASLERNDGTYRILWLKS
jgi:hypothetical protein